MKTILLLLLPMLFFAGCSDNKETIAFTTLPQSRFNAAPFQLPAGIPVDSLKGAHDSCMGFSFDANALFIQKRDSFFIGSIVNRQSLKVVGSIGDFGVTRTQLASQFTVLSNPCYENRVMHVPLASLLGAGFSASLPGVPAAINKELNEAIATANNTNMQTGSWVYLDMRGALMTILDTTHSEAALRYKHHLLDTANMVLTAVESITDVSFIITTPQPLSKPLLAVLQTKPSISTPRSGTSLSLYYLSDNKFQMTLNGFFPVVGQFMKAEMK